MAIVDSAAFTEMRKSFGNLTTCVSNGQTIVRKKVTKVKNPRTLLQQKQRTIFPKMQEWAYTLSAVLEVGYPSYPRVMSREDYFLSLNKGVASADDDLSVTINYSKLVLSKGCRALPETASVTADADSHSLMFSFTEEEGYVAHSASNDLFYAVVLETEKLKAKMEQLGERSGLDSAMMTIPASWNMEALEVFVIVTTQDGKKASKTLYLTIE